jgi:predicted acetyltransferase
MTKIELLLAQPDQLPTLRNLWQLYVHDFTEFIDEEVDESGLYANDFDFRRYLERPGFWAYVPRVAGSIAGFVLLSDRLMDRSKKGRVIDEFFVLRRYRRRGVGRSLAFQAFDTYRGLWEIGELGPNTPAQAFWRKVIEEYTGSRFEESTYEEDEHMQIILQTFDSSLW